MVFSARCHLFLIQDSSLGVDRSPSTFAVAEWSALAIHHMSFASKFPVMNMFPRYGGQGHGPEGFLSKGATVSAQVPPVRHLDEPWACHAAGMDVDG